MPNIKRVVDTPSLGNPEQCWCEQVATDAARRSHKPWQTFSPCAEKVCNFLDRHKSICVKRRTPYDGPKESTEWWKDLMWALNKTNKVLKELVMEVLRRNGAPDDVCVNPGVFEPSVCLSEITPSIFCKLTRLELSLQHTAEYVNGVLLDAKALKSLHIGVATKHWEETSEGFDQSEFSDVLSDCTFPELHFPSINMNHSNCGRDF